MVVGTRNFRVIQPIYRAIADGRKTLEVRLAIWPFSEIAVGERVGIECRDLRTFRVVRAVRHYESFPAMLHHEDLSKLWVDKDSAQILRQLREVYGDRDTREGVLVFELTLVPSTA